jgi:probable HAF family extracellular repeat protein
MVPLGLSAAVTAVNERGDMVGAHAFAGAVTHPFLWRNGKLTDLGELKPTVDGSGTATDINNRGEIVGVSNTESKQPPVRERAFIWRDGVMTPLMALDTQSIANAINDNGQVVGTYNVGEQTHAFLWQDGVLTDLGAGEAVDINDRGQIAGTNADGPWIWYRGRFTYLEAPVAGMRVFELNNAGWAIGTGYVDWEHGGQDTGSGAYLWRNGAVIDLGKIGVGFTTPTDINDWGQIVGATNRNNADYSIPFLWQDGQMIDLTKHGVPRVGPGVGFIDNRGRLVATAAVDGRDQVVMYV